MKLELRCALLGLAFAGDVFVQWQGDAYVRPTQKLNTDLIVQNPDYSDLTAKQLPDLFWKRQNRSDYVQLSQKLGVFATLERILSVKDLGESVFFAEDGELILFKDVVPSTSGLQFVNIVDEAIEYDSFRFGDHDLNILRAFGESILGKLRIGAFLDSISGGEIFHITRFYYPDMENFVEQTGSVLELAKQALDNLLLQVLQNENVDPAKYSPRERELIVDQMLIWGDQFSSRLLETGFGVEDNNLIEFLASKLSEHRFRSLVKRKEFDSALKFGLSNWKDRELAGEKILELVDAEGLDIVTSKTWNVLMAQSDNVPFESLVITGIILEKIDASLLADRAHFDRIVKKQPYDSLWIGSTPEALQAVAKPLSWIAKYRPDIPLPTKILRALSQDEKASELAKECLLKHLILDGDKDTLISWFWSLFGGGKAQFSFDDNLKQKMAEKDLEIAYLSFPDFFDGRPPLSFKKKTLLDLIELGPVDGTIRSVNSILVKLVQLRMDMFSFEELHTTMEWARNSGLSYVLGKQLFELIRKDDSLPSLIKIARLPQPSLQDFPKASDGSFNLETYRSIFTWIPHDLDSEVLQKFEVFCQNMDDKDIAYMLKTTPFRPRVNSILKMRYSIFKKRDFEPIKELRLEDILREHANDPAWLVDLARRQWDPSDLTLIKQVFMAHGFSEQVWRMIRFCPQDQVEEYLGTIQRFNNVPFAFLEYLRVEKKMHTSDIIEYIQSSVSKPTLL